jgi:hypothetical protein
MNVKMAQHKPLSFDISLESLIQRWVQRAADSGESTLRVPLRVYLEEASSLAALMERHLEPLQEDGREYPGLSRVFDEQTLSWETPGEIRELVIVIGELQARSQSTEKRLGPAVLVEARQLRSEWMASLKFLFEQTQDATGKQRLKGLRAEFKDQSQAGLAQSFHNLLMLVQDNMDGLRRLGCSDERLQHSWQAHRTLSERGSERAHLTNERRSEASTRNQLLMQLEARVEAARRAFRFVFRDHDEVLEKAQSNYARARRRKHTDKKTALRAT